MSKVITLNGESNMSSLNGQSWLRRGLRTVGDYSGGPGKLVTDLAVKGMELTDSGEKISDPKSTLTMQDKIRLKHLAAQRKAKAVIAKKRLEINKTSTVTSPSSKVSPQVQRLLDKAKSKSIKVDQASFSMPTEIDPMILKVGGVVVAGALIMSFLQRKKK